MTIEERNNLIDRIKQVCGWNIRPNRFRLVTDTTEWMNINRGHIIRLNGKDYVVRGNMKEPRFGIDDQPKYWVFSAIDLENGKEKIIKTVYDEEFTAHIGFLKIRCFRSQDKESKVLKTVLGDDRFMQGFTAYDEKGNNVRIIDYIKGQSFFRYIPLINKPHKQYFEEDFPEILKKLYKAFLAINHLHDNGLFHGDIRNDHIFIEQNTGKYRWIDFDLNQEVTDFDLWSCGNILSYAVGKGLRTFETVIKSPEFPEDVRSSLRHEDASAFYEYRIMNMQKLFPYIPDCLADILRHFTIKPIKYYDSIRHFLIELNNCIGREFK